MPGEEDQKRDLHQWLCTEGGSYSRWSSLALKRTQIKVVCFACDHDAPPRPEPLVRCVECGTPMRSHAERLADGRLIVDVVACCATCREDVDVIAASKKLDQRARLRRSRQPHRHLRLIKK